LELGYDKLAQQEQSVEKTIKKSKSLEDDQNGKIYLKGPFSPKIYEV
jgi:hypothetical protein